MVYFFFFAAGVGTATTPILMLTAINFSPSMKVLIAASVPALRFSNLAGLPESVMTVVSSTVTVVPPTVIVFASLSTELIFPRRALSFGAFLSAAEVPEVEKERTAANARARMER